MTFRGTLETTCADGSPASVAVSDPDLLVILVHTLVTRVMDYTTFADTAMAIAAQSLVGPNPLSPSGMLDLLAGVSACLTQGAPLV